MKLPVQGEQPASAHTDPQGAGNAVAAIVEKWRDAAHDLLDALYSIGGLSRALRQGGPDPMDLESLSDALTEAIDIAHAAIAKATGESA